MKIAVNLTEEVFRRFTIFDVLKRCKRWRPPVTFALLMGISAAICYWKSDVDGAVLLGNVLLTIGLGMPVVYFTTFFMSLRKEVLKHGLSRPQLVYTFELTQKHDGGIAISNEKEQVSYHWRQVFHVYRDTLATYLYFTPDRGFIIPHTCIEEGPDELWKLIVKKVPEKRRTVL